MTSNQAGFSYVWERNAVHETTLELCTFEQGVSYVPVYYQVNPLIFLARGNPTPVNNDSLIPESEARTVSSIEVWELDRRLLLRERLFHLVPL